MNHQHIFLLLALVWAASNSETSRAAQQFNPPDNSEAPQARAAQSQPGYLLSDGMIKALLKRSAYEYNISQKGRKYPVKSIGEACEAVGAKFQKEQGVSIKTKLPVTILKTDNLLPELEEAAQAE